MVCIVKGCGNEGDEGLFIGELCGPCHSYLVSGRIGPTSSFLSCIPKMSRAGRKMRDAWGSIDAENGKESYVIEWDDAVSVLEV